MLGFTQRKAMLMRNRKISLVLDVGANEGQFGRFLREQVGYTGRIVSFEPLRDAFAGLQKAASQDPLWDCCNMALGDTDATATINVSANSYSSSLLAVSARSLEIEPSIEYVAQEQITVRRLDGILASISRPGDVAYLKIDTQGYEMNILKGALGVLNHFELIQLETSFFQVYQGETLIGDMIKFLEYLGFRVVSIEPGWEDPRTGEMLQADLVFGRK